MADERTYIRVHDGMDENAKIEALSDAAFRLLVSSWCYCSRNLNDGRIADAAWKRRGTPKSRRELEQADLVHKPGHGCDSCPQPAAGHVHMHDYLEHQRSAAEVAAYKEKKSRAGRKSAESRARAKTPASTPVATGVEQPSEQQPNRTATSTETETNPSLRSGSAQQRAHRIPDDFTPDDDLRTWARDRGFTDPQIDEITATFVRHWQAKSGRDATKLNWPKTWQNWVAKEDPRRVHVPPRLVAVSDQDLSRAEVDRILGEDSWQLPPPPPDIDPEEDFARYRAWCQSAIDQHRTERQRQARAQLTGARA